MKEQFAPMAFVFTKQTGHSVLTKYLKYSKSTANLFKNLHSVQDNKQVISMALLNLHESQKIIEDVLKSAEELGVLRYKIGTRNYYLNMGVSYVAGLNQETSQNIQ